jgi:hypothetical protein
MLPDITILMAVRSPTGPTLARTLQRGLIAVNLLRLQLDWPGAAGSTRRRPLQLPAGGVSKHGTHWSGKYWHLVQAQIMIRSCGCCTRWRVSMHVVK